MKWEEDFVMRAVQRLAEFLARVLKLMSSGQLDEARQQLHDACGAVLGIELSALLFMDGGSARAVLRDRERVLVAAELLEVSGQLEAKAGRRELALQRWLKALEFLDGATGARADQLVERLERRCHELA